MYRKRLSFFRSRTRSRYAHSTSSRAFSGSIASVLLWSGVSMITSCAPTPFMRSNNPSPCRSRFPSIPRAGNLFGTTRTLHPGVSFPFPFLPYARISGGVFNSLPGQNGQNEPPFICTLSRTKSDGLFPRSLEIITQRPVIGSLRRSGNLYSFSQSGVSILCSKCILVQTNLRRAPCAALNRHKIEPPGNVSRTALSHKTLCHSFQMPALFGGYGLFRLPRMLFRASPRLHFYKSEHRPIVTHQINLALIFWNAVIPRHENISMPSQIPICICLAVNSSPARRVFR